MISFDHSKFLVFTANSESEVSAPPLKLHMIFHYILSQPTTAIVYSSFAAMAENLTVELGMDQ